MKIKRTIGAVMLTAGLALGATPAFATGHGEGHTPIVVCHNVVHNPHIIVVDDDSTKLQGHLKHRTQEQLLDLVEGYDGTADEIRAKCVSTVEVTEPPVTVTNTVPGPTVTETVTGPPVTVTETGPAVTVTKTVTPTETFTNTAPVSTTTVTAPGPVVTRRVIGAPTTVNVTVPGPTVTNTVTGPDTVVTKNVTGDVVTKFVNKDTKRVVAVERTPTNLAYTGINLLYLAAGLILALLGTVMLMGKKIITLRA